MGIVSSILAGKGDISLAQLDDWMEQAISGLPTLAGTNVNEENSLNLIPVFACVRLIANTIATLPFPVYRYTRGGGKVRDWEHPLYPILHDSPNAEMTAFDFWAATSSHLERWGNSYAEIQRGAYDGQVQALWPLDPSKMAPNHWGEDGRLIYRYRLPNGQPKYFHSSLLMHIRGFGSNGITGYGPISLARQGIGLAKALEAYGATFFANDSRPGGVLSVEGKLAKDGRDALKLAWEEAHRPLDQKHRIAVLDAGAKWQATSLPNEDSQFLESRKFQTGEIATLFGVPPHMIGDTDRSTSWGCLPGETMVYTTSGPVPIKDVRSGDSVWSMGEGGLQPARVTAQWMTGYKQVMAIEMASRTLSLTENHRLLVRRKSGARWASIWTSAGDVRAGDYVAVPHELPAATGEYAPNGRYLTVALMELAGLFTGDGSLDKNRIEIAHGCDRDGDHMGHYRGIIRDEFGAEPYSDPRGTRTRFSSAAAIEFLGQKFTGTARTKRVPGWVFGLRPELVTAFLRGYLDSDGSVQRGRIIFASANRLLLEDVRHLSMQVGVPVGRVVVGRKAGPGVIRGRVHEVGIKYQLSLSSVPYNARIGSNSPHKAERLNAQTTSRRLSYDDGWRGVNGRKTSPMISPGDGWMMENLKLQCVRRVRPADGLAIPVYDLSVEGTASYIADGVLVHNSGIEQQTTGWYVTALRARLVMIEQRVMLDLFTPAERRTHKAEFVADGLLRGDASTRHETYQKGIQNGYYSINDVLRLENRNPIGPEGDRRFVNGNMVPIDQAGVQRVAPPGNGQSAHLREIVREAAARVVRKEIAAMGKAARRIEPLTDAAEWASTVAEFYGDHVDFVCQNLRIERTAAEGYAAEQRDALQASGPNVMDDWPYRRVDDLVRLALGGD